jgi:hypothetical protein
MTHRKAVRITGAIRHPHALAAGAIPPRDPGVRRTEPPRAVVLGEAGELGGWSECRLVKKGIALPDDCTANTTRLRKPWRITSEHTSASAIPCPAKKQNTRSLGGASAYRQTVRISVDQTACPAILHLSMLMEPPKLRVAARTEVQCRSLTIPLGLHRPRGVGDVPPQRALVRGENPASPLAMSRHARSLVSS